jgi:hypothetical protein
MEPLYSAPSSNCIRKDALKWQATPTESSLVQEGVEGGFYLIFGWFADASWQKVISQTAFLPAQIWKGGEVLGPYQFPRGPTWKTNIWYSSNQVGGSYQNRSSKNQDAYQYASSPKIELRTSTPLKNLAAYQYASLKSRCVTVRILQFFPLQHLAMYHPGHWLVSSFLQHASIIGDSRLCRLHFDTCSFFQPCALRGWHTPFHLEAHRFLMLSRHLVVWPFIRELTTKWLLLPR